MATQYVVMRTSGQEREWIFEELKKGRLRQGWGTHPEQDLTRIIARRRQGKSKQLTDHEKSAWGNRRMLGDTWNGLQRGDIILAPNLPSYGRWVLLRVTGDYRYDHDSGAPHPGDYYRHILPVEPVGGKLSPINPRNLLVDARLRGTMRSMRRLWGIDHLAGAVDTLIEALERGDDLSGAQTRDERSAEFLNAVRQDIDNATWLQLSQKYRGAEFEHLLVHLFDSIYGNSSAEHTGGSGERGADLIVTAPGPLGLSFRVAVQAKLYDGELNDLGALDKLLAGVEHHHVQGVVLLTTALTTSDAFDEHHRKLQEDTAYDVQVWTREHFVRLVLQHLVGDVSDDA